MGCWRVGGRLPPRSPLPHPPPTHAATLATMQATLAAKPVAVARPARSALAPRRAAAALRPVVVRSGVEPGQIETAIKDAKDACAGGSTGEW